ncbi:hypothetical protein L1049_009069 [Liquidambar formosana]|uniref:Uncharacterized protein n=1 Tax=Liquidambar formosana TaxID=63359 RepID=A0AAP0X9R2_LIQFO
MSGVPCRSIFGPKMMEIVEKSQEITRERDGLRFSLLCSGKDKEMLEKFLLPEEFGESEMSLVVVVGMGGLGNITFLVLAIEIAYIIHMF